MKESRTTRTAEITALLERVPEDELGAVLDFVSQLARRQAPSDARETMLAAEAVLSRDWDTPDEDMAWAHL